MTQHRKDLSDRKDPNPDRDEQYPGATMKHETIEGRSFAGAEYAEVEEEQADERNSGPPTRGNRSDDVQHSDRVRPPDGAGPSVPGPRGRDAASMRTRDDEQQDRNGAQ